MPEAHYQMALRGFSNPIPVTLPSEPVQWEHTFGYMEEGKPVADKIEVSYFGNNSGFFGLDTLPGLPTRSLPLSRQEGANASFLMVYGEYIPLIPSPAIRTVDLLTPEPILMAEISELTQVYEYTRENTSGTARTQGVLHNGEIYWSEREPPLEYRNSEGEVIMTSEPVELKVDSTYDISEAKNGNSII